MKVMPKPSHCSCERKTFDDLCSGLTQQCQCQAYARKMINTVQVCLHELSEHSSPGVHACINNLERTRPSCRVSVSAVYTEAVVGQFTGTWRTLPYKSEVRSVIFLSVQDLISGLCMHSSALVSCQTWAHWGHGTSAG